MAEIYSYKVLSIIQLKAVKDTQYTSDFQNKINNHDAKLQTQSLASWQQFSIFVFFLVTTHEFRIKVLRRGDTSESGALLFNDHWFRGAPIQLSGIHRAVISMQYTVLPVSCLDDISNTDNFQVFLFRFSTADKRTLWNTSEAVPDL